LVKIGKQDKSGYKDWLLGRINFVYSIEPEVGKKMLEEFGEIMWPF